MNTLYFLLCSLVLSISGFTVFTCLAYKHRENKSENFIAGLIFLIVIFFALIVILFTKIFELLKAMDGLP